MLVEHVVVAVFGNVVLQESKAVAVNRPDIHRPNPIQEGSALSLLHALEDSIL